MQVQPGEKTGVHLSIHKADRMRYNGMEEYYNTDMMDQHILETEASLQTQRAPSQKGSQNQGPGEEGGNAIAGAMGGLMGG